MKTIHKCKRLWFNKVLYLFKTFCFIVLLQKSKDSRKGPVVILSITYRGVKFIDAATKVIDTSLCVCVCGGTVGDYWSVKRKVCLWSTQSASLSIWFLSVRLLWRSTRSGIFRALLRIQMTSALLLTLPRIWRVATIFAMSLALWKWWVKYIYLFTHKIDMACIKIGQNCFCSLCLFSLVWILARFCSVCKPFNKSSNFTKAWLWTCVLYPTAKTASSFLWTLLSWLAHHMAWLKSPPLLCVTFPCCNLCLRMSKTRWCSNGNDQ